jgi:hypothetical protein
MPKVDVNFEEQAAEFREREVSLKLIIKNSGASPIEIRAISPRLPERAILVETKDFSLLAPKTMHTALCSQLTHLANDVLQITDEKFRARLVEIQRQSLQKILSDVSGFFGIFKLYLQMFTGGWARRFEEQKAREAAVLLAIENSEDAERAFERLIGPSKADDALKETFVLKTAKLRAVEKELGQGIDVEEAPVATVEPDSSLTVTYVIRFPRNWLNPSQFSVSIETVFQEPGESARHNRVATKLVDISPSPIALTLVAMISAMLGLALKHLVPQATSGSALLIANILPSSELVGAVILALVFFNLFEFTDLLKNVRMRLGWRSALLVGVFCGLGSDRIFNALQALLGT